MKWSEVRNTFPNQIVLVEALETSLDHNVRTVNEMAVVSEFHDNMEAWQEYKKIHKQNPEKELYIFHTSKDNAEVIEQFFAGIRGRT
ncbi:hypothetical protein SAMN05216389_10747 [Oceanobacillus limi]|uniref:Uncharacterized protein n=1 Tax=Oceanobacillus limi TaxID=930131 RepID=A0A1I0CRV9_9BACI|nr:hypothetical protein [Oceanobacillus limi]SET22415.1 hypothetical protein SAMN05216389_10747 [Oceanobacillus limi]